MYACVYMHVRETILCFKHLGKSYCVTVAILFTKKTTVRVLETFFWNSEFPRVFYTFSLKTNLVAYIKVFVEEAKLYQGKYEL